MKPLPQKQSYHQDLQFDVKKGIEPPKIRPEKIFDMMGATKTPKKKSSKSKSK
jgi:hypothetical protein